MLSGCKTKAAIKGLRLLSGCQAQSPVIWVTRAVTGAHGDDARRQPKRRQHMSPTRVANGPCAGYQDRQLHSLRKASKSIRNKKLNIQKCQGQIQDQIHANGKQNGCPDREIHRRKVGAETIRKARLVARYKRRLSRQLGQFARRTLEPNLLPVAMQDRKLIA